MARQSEEIPIQQKMVDLTMVGRFMIGTASGSAVVDAGLWLRTERSLSPCGRETERGVQLLDTGLMYSTLSLALSHQGRGDWSAVFCRKPCKDAFA